MPPAKISPTGRGPGQTRTRISFNMKILNNQERASVLAALYVYQQQLGLNGGLPPPDVAAIAGAAGEPLNVDQIDALSEEMGSGEDIAVDPDLLSALGNLTLFGGAGGSNAEEEAKAAYDAAMENE